MKSPILTVAFLFGISSLAIASEPDVLAPSPTPSKVVEIYGFPVGEPNLPLKWSVYTPTGSGPWPAVLVIHVGGFKSGSRNDAPLVVCANDLANAGYLALAVSYRLAPPGHLQGQLEYHDDGRYPKQSEDIQMAIRTARADPRCNGQVGAVGGSAGATHAAVAAVMGTEGDDRLDVAVCLSGAYDFSDFRPDPNINQFKANVINYVNSSDKAVLLADSPVSQVTAPVAPLFLVNTAMDTMPFVQLGDMVSKLSESGVTNFEARTLPGSLHAFDYWPQIKKAALNFLAEKFAGPPQSP